MALVDIALLGRLEVSLGGEPVTEFESVTTQALLARLAVEPGQAVSRAALAELLWPGRPERNALGNLRHSLAVLRRSIGDHEAARPVLRSSPAGLALDPGAEVRIDAAEFRQLTDVRASELDAVASWQAAASLWRGPFLDGLDAELSEEWETWLLTTRAGFDVKLATVHRRLAELRRRTGELGEARLHASHWVDLEPWNEQAHRLYMEILALDDRRADALAHAEMLCQSFADELGLEVSGLTHQLITGIREGRFPVRPCGLPQLPPIAEARTAEPCVAREGELTWLHHHLEDALAGDGRLVFIAGAAGTGKSVLLRAFEAAATQRMPSVVVTRGAGNAFGGSGDPYLPFRQILGQLCGDLDTVWTEGLLTSAEAAQLWAGVPDAVEALLEDAPDLLGTFVDADALCHRFEAGFPGHVLSPRLHAAAALAARRASAFSRRQLPLLDQAVTVFTRLASKRPLLIVLDDLHFADAGSLELLGHLGRTLRGAPMLIVCAYRPRTTVVGSRVDGALELTVQEARAHAGSECVLELNGSREFIDAWLDREANALGETFREELFRATRGHALFTVEMVRAMRERGDLRLDEAGRWDVGDEVHWAGVPPRVDATVAARLLELPDELRRDLEAASVQGDSFATEVVARVRDQPMADIVLRLSGIAKRPHALLEYEGSEGSVGGLHRYRFRHGLFSQYLRDHLEPLQRQLLHEGTARCLEAEYAGRLDERAVELATHFDQAGLLEPAIDYWQRAAHRALTRSATAEATGHLERARELLDSMPPSRARAERELALSALARELPDLQSGLRARKA